MKIFRRNLSLPLVLFDILGIYFSFYLAFRLRFESGLFAAERGIPGFLPYMKSLPVLIIIWVFIFWNQKIYKNLHYDFLLDWFQLVRAVFMSLVITVALGFFYREFSYSRLVAFFLFIIALLLLAIVHFLTKRLVYGSFRYLFFPSRMLLIGEGKLVRALKRRLKREHIISLVCPDFPDRVRLSKLVTRRNIQGIVVARSPIDHAKSLEIADICEENGLSFFLVPDILELRLGDLVMDTLLGVPILHLKPTPLSGFNQYVKALFDVFLSIGALSLLSFPLIFFSLLIKMESSGPVFYAQLRMGRKGKVFRFYKFRSMVQNADDLLERIRHLSDRSGPVFKMKKDPRVTWIGKFLRKFSMDELPQIWNVLKGEMSLVGPRPQVLWEAEAYDRDSIRGDD